MGASRRPQESPKRAPSKPQERPNKTYSVTQRRCHTAWLWSSLLESLWGRKISIDALLNDARPLLQNALSEQSARVRMQGRAWAHGGVRNADADALPQGQTHTERGSAPSPPSSCSRAKSCLDFSPSLVPCLASSNNASRPATRASRLAGPASLEATKNTRSTPQLPIADKSEGVPLQPRAQGWRKTVQPPHSDVVARLACSEY